MFNKEEWENAIKESGLRKRYICDQMGISYDSFVKKAQGKLEWKLPEVTNFCKILKLNKGARDKIFFA